MLYVSVVKQGGSKFIVKINHNLDEQKILEYLHSREQQSNHIIRPIGIYTSNLEPGIVLSFCQSIEWLMVDSKSTKPKGPKGWLEWFCCFAEDLISGLQLLHSHLVAHWDIKPGNLVYLPGFGLQIIDFDVAVKLDKDTDIMNDIVGTQGYMAPELNKNRRLLYNPLKANS